MSPTRIVMLITLTFGTGTVLAQSNTSEPHIGYLYPAGARQGTVIRIVAGGQFLRNPTNVHLSGPGVHATIVKYYRPVGNINRDQRLLIQQKLKDVRDKRLAEAPARNPQSRNFPPQRKAATPDNKPRIPARSATADRNSNPATAQGTPAPAPEVTMPEHPLLEDLDNQSLRQLAHISDMLFFPRTKRQMNRQLAESVLIEITVDADAAPGFRELRLETALGLTNPVTFQVATFPEILELEPNNRQAYATLPNAPDPEPAKLPAVFNGQIMPGDVDRFRFRARKGQNLVVEAHARSLIPYLADAVPGWFQATLALYDEKGAEIAFADDYGFNPDPVLFYHIPADGQYELEIRDALYRGREDFIYRVVVGLQPFITQAFPLGAKAGSQTFASIAGFNLPVAQLPLDARPGEPYIRTAVYDDGKRFSNPIPYAVDDLPQGNELESNNSDQEAQSLTLPIVIDGRIQQSGDIDVFGIDARAGDTIVAEVLARRLNSPLDAVLKLTDAAGGLLQCADDHVHQDAYLYKDLSGLLTHHADPYLTATLPADGTYYLRLADAQNHGGPAFAYRLRIGPPRPDFALRLTPSGLTVGAGGTVPFTVHILRKDGFDGPVTVGPDPAYPGFKVDGGRIPPGVEHIQMTLTAPPDAPVQAYSLALVGRARVQGQQITHPVVPAEDMTQAFLYRHLVPAQQFLVNVTKSARRLPPLEIIADNPLRIPAGQTTNVSINVPRRPLLNEIRLELHQPPQGLTLSDLTVTARGLAFRLHADANAFSESVTDNLIIEVFREFTPKLGDGTLAKTTRRVSMGFLPALPITIIRP